MPLQDDSVDRMLDDLAIVQMVVTPIFSGPITEALPRKDVSICPENKEPRPSKKAKETVITNKKKTKADPFHFMSNKTKEPPYPGIFVRETERILNRRAKTKTI